MQKRSKGPYPHGAYSLEGKEDVSQSERVGEGRHKGKDGGMRAGESVTWHLSGQSGKPTWRR